MAIIVPYNFDIKTYQENPNSHLSQFIKKDEFNGFIENQNEFNESLLYEFCADVKAYAENFLMEIWSERTKAEITAQIYLLCHQYKEKYSKYISPIFKEYIMWKTPDLWYQFQEAIHDLNPYPDMNQEYFFDEHYCVLYINPIQALKKLIEVLGL